MVEVDGARVYWCILKSYVEDSTRKDRSDVITCAGHVATIYQDELYDFSYGKAGSSCLNNFGITFGVNQVVIYVEPTNGSQVVTTDTARTMLRINSLPLPWSEWQAEFILKMPQEIKDFMNSQVDGRSKSSVHELLKDMNLAGVYDLNFYRANKRGKVSIDVVDAKLESGGDDVFSVHGDGVRGGGVGGGGVDLGGVKRANLRFNMVIFILLLLGLVVLRRVWLVIRRFLGFSGMLRFLFWRVMLLVMVRLRVGLLGIL